MNEIDDSIAIKFMQHAKGHIEKSLYDKIYKMAIGEAKAVIQPKKKAPKPVAHVAERLKERYAINANNFNLQEIIDVYYQGQLISVVYTPRINL